MEDAKNEKALTRAQALAILCCMVGTESVGVADDSEIESRNCPALVRQLEAVLGVGALPHENMVRRHGYGLAGAEKVEQVKGLRGLCDLLREVADAVAPVRQARPSILAAGVLLGVTGKTSADGPAITLHVELPSPDGRTHDLVADFAVLAPSETAKSAIYYETALRLSGKIAP